MPRTVSYRTPDLVRRRSDLVKSHPLRPNLDLAVAACFGRHEDLEYAAAVPSLYQKGSVVGLGDALSVQDPQVCEAIGPDSEFRAGDVHVAGVDARPAQHGHSGCLELAAADAPARGNDDAGRSVVIAGPGDDRGQE